MGGELMAIVRVKKTSDYTVIAIHICVNAG